MKENFENRSAFDKVRGKDIVAPFSGHGVLIAKPFICVAFPSDIARNVCVIPYSGGSDELSVGCMDSMLYLVYWSPWLSKQIRFQH